MTHSEVIDKVLNWLKKESACRFAFKELPGDSTYGTGESPDVIAFHGAWTVMVEVKVSRQDFLKDAEKPFRANPAIGVGNYRLYACPEGLINIDDLPKGWGLIWITERGAVKLVHGKVKGGQKHLIRRRFWFDSNLESERGLLFTAMSRVYYSGFIGVVNSWTSAAYNALIESGQSEANAKFVAEIFDSVPAPTQKPRRKKKVRSRK